MRDRVTKLFEELQPDAVITWGPSGWTGHPDHRLVSDIVTEVFQSRKWQRPAQLYYPAVPTGKVRRQQSDSLATVDESFLTVRVPVSTGGLREVESRLAVSPQPVHAGADGAALSSRSSPRRPASRISSRRSWGKGRRIRCCNVRLKPDPSGVCGSGFSLTRRPLRISSPARRAGSWRGLPRCDCRPPVFPGRSRQRSAARHRRRPRRLPP